MDVRIPDEKAIGYGAYDSDLAKDNLHDQFDLSPSDVADLEREPRRHMEEDFKAPLLPR